MGMMKEFKTFAIKGNLVDTAIAFVMGAAFGKVVSAFIDGMVMPLIGKLSGGVDFKEMAYVLQTKVAEVKDTTGKVITAAVPEVSVKYGAFVTEVIDFIVVAFVVFMVIKTINKMKKKEAETPSAPPEPSSTDKLLVEIRDALKK